MSLRDSLKKQNKVIVIVGPTGSGKTGVSIEIAKEIGGEIISADSRAIYKRMDLGTAKPSLEEREGISHYGFDLVEPSERFTVADWKDYAEQKITEIEEKGKMPIVVGGTGLYVDALIFDYQFEKNKNILSKKSVQDKSVMYPDRNEMCSKYVIYGVKTDPDVLRERLKKRANKLFVQELFDETKWLVEKYGWDNQAMKSNIYQFAWKYMEGEISLDKAIELNVFDDWHLAKRQITWFKRNPNIVWLPLEKIKPAVLKCIYNE